MKYFLVAIISLVLFNCSPKLAPDSGWGRQQWTVVELRGVPVQQSGGRRDAHLVFETGDRRFHGNGGCNQVNGNYQIDKRTIKFTDVVTTKMSCNDIEFENAFLNELSRVDRYEINGDEIRLKRRQETLLVLRAK